MKNNLHTGSATSPSRGSVPRPPLVAILVSGLLLAAYIVAHPTLFTVLYGSYGGDITEQSASELRSKFRKSIARCSEVLDSQADYTDPTDRRNNARWDALGRDTGRVLLRNATLFDGESFLSQPVDILLDRGLIVSVVNSSLAPAGETHATSKIYDVRGGFVTPGLIDMHSHQLVGTWPISNANDDVNELSHKLGPLLPFLRAMDGMKAHDGATRWIMSGGITSSFIIPGSANIMGGEGTVIKNVPRPGAAGEHVVEHMLLEHGVAPEKRHRYMKVACGENPKTWHEHTRMGLTWLLREHLSKARALRVHQDEYCSAAAVIQEEKATASEMASFLRDQGEFPEKLELESTVAMLRGRVAMHNHCYLPGDMETMMRTSREFGFRVKAFHHATSAWSIPELLREYGNLTIAMFAETSLYKHESSQGNLSAGKILSEHGISVAYKSDHMDDELNAKTLLSQAAIAHSFRLPEDIALQSITSAPARALDLDYRIGYAREGYDADIVVWSAHPLSLGTIPLQVFVDGIPQLEEDHVNRSFGRGQSFAPSTTPYTAAPAPRKVPSADERAKICTETISRPSGRPQTYVITGIRKSYLDLGSPTPEGTSRNLTLLIKNGEVVCFGDSDHCLRHPAAGTSDSNVVVRVDLSNGHLLPGLTALATTMGMADVLVDEGTGDGYAELKTDVAPEDIPFAKYGVSLGKSPGVSRQSFNRASLGGVTKAIAAPLSKGGLLQGVSVGFRVGGERDLLAEGSIFRGEVALHVSLRGSVRQTQGSVSLAVGRLRKLIAGNQDKAGAEGNIYERVADGHLPLIVDVEDLHSTQQAILLKRDFPNVNIVLRGGRSLHLVATEIAEAGIPVILFTNFNGPSGWEAKDGLEGPPLTRSTASILQEAGVVFALSLESAGQSRLHNLILEASWTARYSNLDDRAAVRLVTSNVEGILGLPASKDFVVWESDPLEYGASVVLSFSNDAESETLTVGSCWPNEQTHM